MWIHFIALNPDKSSCGHMKSHNNCCAVAVFRYNHDHYVKVWSCYSIFSQEELHSAVTEEEPKVPGYKGRSSSMYFPNALYGKHGTIEKSLGTHLPGWRWPRQCLVVWCMGKMSKSVVLMSFKSVCVLERVWGCLAALRNMMMATVHLPQGHKNTAKLGQLVGFLRISLVLWRKTKISSCQLFTLQMREQTVTFPVHLPGTVSSNSFPCHVSPLQCSHSWFLLFL